MNRNDPFCWEISGCAEHLRECCEAFLSGRNCWEVPGTPINSDNQAACETCPVILSRIARAVAQAIGHTQSSPARR